MRAILFFVVFLFPCVALAGEPSATFKTMAGQPGCNPSGFGNLIATACWSYGGVYLLFAAVQAFRQRQLKRQQPQEKPARTGIEFFILSGIMLVAYPFLKSLSYSMMKPEKPTLLPDGTFILGAQPQFNTAFFDTPLMLLVVAAPFFPWLALIFSKKLRHLRRQGVIGLGITSLVPCIFLAVMFAALSLTS